MRCQQQQQHTICQGASTAVPAQDHGNNLARGKGNADVSLTSKRVSTFAFSFASLARRKVDSYG